MDSNALAGQDGKWFLYTRTEFDLVWVRCMLVGEVKLVVIPGERTYRFVFERATAGQEVFILAASEVEAWIDVEKVHTVEDAKKALRDSVFLATGVNIQSPFGDACQQDKDGAQYFVLDYYPEPGSPSRCKVYRSGTVKAI